MTSAYLVVRYSIEKKKFTSCEIWSSSPWEQSIMESDEIWFAVFETFHNSFQEAIDSMLFYIASGNYPEQWNEFLHLMSDSYKRMGES